MPLHFELAARVPMNATDILQQLSGLGAPGYKKILLNHGAQEPVLGVKISELKKFQKRIKKDYPLSLELYKTGIYDAQYLAGLIADETRMTKADLRRWLSKANCMAISGTAVAWVAAESRHGYPLSLEWIDSPDEIAAHTGWITLGAITSFQPDAALDLTEIERLLQRVEQTIHRERNQVRYAMNQFVICVGSYVAALTATAIATAERIGPVSVDMGPTACTVPAAADSIQKVKDRGTIGKKRKTVRC